MSKIPHLLVIDSGIGGLGLVERLKDQLACFELTYVADQAFFPYGEKSKDQLEQRVERVVRDVDSKIAVNMIVIACNSASTVVLEHLRHCFTVPVVGMVPAIKLAANLTKTNEFGILATNTTIKGVYLQTLIQTFATHCDVYQLAATNLANLAEQKLNGNKVLLGQLAKEIQPLFDQSLKMDHVILGCTHYPFLLDELKAAAPYEVNWIDPALNVAEHIKNLLGVIAQNDNKQQLSFYTTSDPNHYQKLAHYRFQKWSL